MAWPKGRKLSASHKAAISRSLKGRSRLGRPANRRTGVASRRIVKRVLSNKKVQSALLNAAAGGVVAAAGTVVGRQVGRQVGPLIGKNAEFPIRPMGKYRTTGNMTRVRLNYRENQKWAVPGGRMNGFSGKPVGRRREYTY